MNFGLGSIATSVFAAARSTVSVVSSTVFAFVIAVYVLASKRVLGRQVNRMMDAHLAPRHASRIRHVAALATDTYSKFLSGQCLEACILGTLIFIAFSLFRLPYAGLIGFLTAVFAFVPYVGAFASCAIGAFLTLLASPGQAIICVIVYLAVQFVENQFIYPHVVGSSVGLSALWTLIAALVGGKLFGIVGIVFFIPIVAVLYELVRQWTNTRLAERMARRDRLRMIEIRDITKTYKTGDLVQRALDGVSVTFRESEFVAVLGPSGSGKTTFLNILGGFDHADSGDIVVNGTSTRDYGCGVGHIPQPPRGLHLPELQPHSASDDPRQRGARAHVGGRGPR